MTTFWLVNLVDVRVLCWLDQIPRRLVCNATARIDNSRRAWLACEQAVFKP